MTSLFKDIHMACGYKCDLRLHVMLHVLLFKKITSAAKVQLV